MGGRGVGRVAVTGGGLTLWLQDANEPPPPAEWQEAPTPQQTADTVCPMTVHAARPTPVFCGQGDGQGFRRRGAV